MLIATATPPVMPDYISILIEHYGPIAFGLVALLILWKVIVEPTLRENKADQASVERTAIANQTTARTLERAIEKLGTVADKFDEGTLCRAPAHASTSERQHP